MSTTERFNEEQFGDALLAAVGYDEDNLYKLEPIGINRELRWAYIVQSGLGKYQDLGVGIYINSSVSEITGLADGTGQNSIRAWLVDNDGKPLGSKTQRWVTRESGWQGRLSKLMGELISLATKIEYCEGCGQLEKIFKVKKEGQNKGRRFKKCGCRFIWLEDYSPDAPRCPKCQGPMRLRPGKYGEFWGCLQFPKCRGTRDGSYVKPVDEGTVEPSEEVNGYHATAVTVDEAARIGTVLDSIDEGTSDWGKAVSTTVKDHLQDDISTDTKQAIKDARNGNLQPKEEFVPSPAQQDIFSWTLENMELINTTGQGRHLVVRAKAGTGKTTTGLQMLEYTKGLDVMFCAFNKAIQLVLADRAPKHVKVKTFHAMGFGACRQAFDLHARDDVDPSKLYKIFKNVVNMDIHKHIFPPVRQLIGLVKANLLGTTDEELRGLADYYNIELNKSEALIFETVRVVFSRSVEMTTSVDYDDQCYFPVYHDLPMHQFDLIFVDEAQDTNKNQTALIMKSIKPTGTIIAVGDDFQSMYGFRGANVDAIENLIGNLDADQLPLSMTYRCPHSHVRKVNERFPEIEFEPWEGNGEGEILNWTIGQALMNWKVGDMVLCRTNAPLVAPCFALLRKGVKATIRGRDIGKGLIDTIRKMEADDVGDLMVKLIGYRDLEVDKLLRADKKTQAASLQDRIETIIALSDGLSMVYELETRITDIFSDKSEGVVFSTIHKAKGLEADHVSILEPNLMPHPAASKEWELAQERNIEYVALTRSKETLVFVV